MGWCWWWLGGGGWGGAGSGGRIQGCPGGQVRASSGGARAGPMGSGAVVEHGAGIGEVRCFSGGCNRGVLGGDREGRRLPAYSVGGLWWVWEVLRARSPAPSASFPACKVPTNFETAPPPVMSRLTRSARVSPQQPRRAVRLRTDLFLEFYRSERPSDCRSLHTKALVMYVCKTR